MDNNKIVDNLNFIKIYFRIFIYKIIVLKKLELDRNDKKKKKKKKSWMEDENISRYKDWIKKLRRRVQMVPEHKSGFDIQKHHWALLGFSPTAFG